MADVPPIVAGIVRRMHHLADRQRVIAQNIANSETPGYKSRDIAAPDFATLLANTGAGAGRTRIARPTVSPTAGMAALGATAPRSGNIVRDPDVGETKPDGNDVTIEDQLLRMGQVQADFAAMTSLYRKQQTLLKTALGRGGGG